VSFALPPAAYMRMEHTETMGLLTHVASADCLVRVPHSALACGIVTAWWRFQVEPATLTPRHSEDEQGPRREQGRV
jgi:hypothetical protein